MLAFEAVRQGALPVCSPGWERRSGGVDVMGEDEERAAELRRRFGLPAGAPSKERTDPVWNEAQRLYTLSQRFRLGMLLITSEF